MALFGGGSGSSWGTDATAQALINPIFQKSVIPNLNLSTTPQKSGAEPAEPADINQTAGYNTGGGSQAASSSYWNEQNRLVNEQLNRLGGQENTGLNNILNSYNSAFQNLTNQRERARQDFDTTRDQTNQDNLKARENINSGVRNQLNGLQRLLGNRGAGTSSAAGVLAPYAAGRLGNQQMQQVQDAYSRNVSGIDTSRKRAEEDFESAFGGLNTDRSLSENKVRSGIAEARQRLLSQKATNDLNMGRAADPSVTNQISELARLIDSYAAEPVFTPKAVDVTRPDLAQYDYTRGIGAQASNGAESNLGSFYNLISGKKKQASGA